MIVVTPTDLKVFAPLCNAVRFAPLVSEAANRVEVIDVAHWLAHIHVETMGLTRFTEGLNYSAERLTVVWPTRFPTLASTKGYARNPDALAEKVYGGRLGNDHPGDGAAFIGRGALQRTGRAGYTEATVAAKRRGRPVSFLLTPSALAWSDYAFQDAADFWNDHGLNEGPMDVGAATQVINGGFTGLADRQEMLERARDIWG